MNANHLTSIQQQIINLLEENFQVKSDIIFKEQIDYFALATRIDKDPKKSLVDDLHQFRLIRNKVIHNESGVPSDEVIQTLYSRIFERIFRFVVPELENVPYIIFNKNSGRVLDDPWEYGNGKVHQWEKHGGSNQRWIIRKTFSGNFVIISSLSGKCLGIENESLEQPAWAEVNAYTGKPNQQFRFSQLDDGSYSISAVHSGLSLDVFECNTENGAWVTQWEWHGEDNQRWYINPAF